MRRFPVALIPLGLALALAACGRDETTSPRSISAGQRSSALSVTPVVGDACGFDDMKGYARAFFKSGSDPAFKFITDMQAAYGTGGEAGAVAATPFAWKIFKDIATVRLTSAQAGTSTDGANLVIEVANCTTLLTGTLLTTPPHPLTAPADFTSANLAVALSGGIFEVRGDNVAAGPARAYLSSGGRVEASPIWGVEPKAGTQWAANSPFLIYGYPKLYGATDIATYINTNGPGGATAYDGFELGRIPSDQSVSNFLVGICKKALVPATTSTPAVAKLLVHNSINQVNASPSTALCTTITASNSLTGRLMQRLATVLSPAPLFAQGDGDTRIGGLPSDWSPNTTGTIEPSDVWLYFSTPQTDGTVNTALNVVVLATEDEPNGTTPVSGVVVTLSVAGNNGQPVKFKKGNVLSLTATAVTDATGHASFSDYTLVKAGGYTLAATGSVAGLAPTANSLTSLMFNIQNK